MAIGAIKSLLGIRGDYVVRLYKMELQLFNIFDLKQYAIIWIAGKFILILVYIISILFETRVMKV